MSDPMKVVDYDAWQRGYMPPNEHVLIDALAYRGARVVASSHIVRGNGWWLVVQGDPFDWEAEFDLMMFVTERQAKYAKERRKAAEAVGAGIVTMFTQAEQSDV